MYRVFALFEMLKNEFDCILFTLQSSEILIIPRDFKYHLIPSDIVTFDEINWITKQYPIENTWMILDGYEFNDSYMLKIKKCGFRLAYIDDLLKQGLCADIIINHSLNAKTDNYPLMPTTKLLLGTQFAILRPSFLMAAKEKLKIKNITKVLVCFGGADSLNLTLYAVKALVEQNPHLQINVLIGAAYQHSELFDLAEHHPQIFIHKNLEETGVLEVMKDSQLAIASASNILYELFTVKMPVICGYYVDNQKGIYEGSVANKLIFGIGNIEQFKAVDFEKVIRPILQMESFSDYLNNQAKLFDDKIKARFINLFSEITYRKAQKDDLMQVFKWSNDPITRNNSYNSGTISLETHQQWFNKKLNDASSIIYMAEVNGQPAGMVRYEVLATHSVVGVLIDPDHRGRGLASIFLQATANLFFENHSVSIWAYIKKTNQASIKSFERAHYKKLKDELVEGIESTIYCLDKNYL